MTTITWTREKLADLKTAFAEADGKDFDFVEKTGVGIFAREVARHPIVNSYAKYLIEYLEGEFARHADQAARPNNEGEEGQ